MPSESKPIEVPPDPTVESLYDQWKAQPSPEGMGKMLRKMEPLIKSQLGKYTGTLPRAALQGQAKRFAAQAVKSYDPTKGAKLTTHVVNALQQLHRKNYEAQSAFRLSEELQRAMGTYNRAVQNLQGEIGREPTAAEVSQELAWPLSKVQRPARLRRRLLRPHAGGAARGRRGTGRRGGVCRPGGGVGAAGRDRRAPGLDRDGTRGYRGPMKSRGKHGAP